MSDKQLEIKRIDGPLMVDYQRDLKVDQATPKVGDHINFQVRDHDLYHVGVIKFEIVSQRYTGRIGFYGLGGRVFFNSDHPSFSDAERSIGFTKDGKMSSSLYNIFAEIVDIHTSPGLPGEGVVTVFEVRPISYSFILEGVSTP